MFCIEALRLVVKAVYFIVAIFGLANISMATDLVETVRTEKDFKDHTLDYFWYKGGRDKLATLRQLTGAEVSLLKRTANVPAAPMGVQTPQSIDGALPPDFQLKITGTQEGANAAENAIKKMEDSLIVEWGNLPFDRKMWEFLRQRQLFYNNDAKSPFIIRLRPSKHNDENSRIEIRAIGPRDNFGMIDEALGRLLDIKFKQINFTSSNARDFMDKADSLKSLGIYAFLDKKNLIGWITSETMDLQAAYAKVMEMIDPQLQ